ncbi:MAG: C40 family peptidase [Chlorobiaceae bacterium]
MPPELTFSSSYSVSLPLKKLSRACFISVLCITTSVCQFALTGVALCDIPSETTVQTAPVAGSTRLTASMQSFFNSVSQYFGTRYRVGGQTPGGFDCSGFVRFMYDKVFNMQLPRSSREMSAIGNKVSKNDLQPGDLVFFQTRGQRINHVGIFIGNDTFVHSSLSKGITEDKIKLTYYEKRFAGAVRLLDPSTDKLPPLPLQQQEAGSDITKPS